MFSGVVDALDSLDGSFADILHRHRLKRGLELHFKSFYAEYVVEVPWRTLQ